MKYFFYKIVNKRNGKSYIGMTKRSVDVRYSEHIRCAMRNHDINNNYVMPMYNALRKYGTDVFCVEEVYIQEVSSHIEAEIIEGKLIEENESLLSQNGYNLNKMNVDGKRTYEKEIHEKIVHNNTGLNNPFFGKKHTAETRHILSEKAKERFSEPKNNPRYGYRYTEEDKAKHRESKRRFGKPFWAEGVFYQTLSEAALKYNLTKQAIKHRIDSNSYKDWYYV